MSHLSFQQTNDVISVKSLSHANTATVSM